MYGPNLLFGSADSELVMKIGQIQIQQREGFVMRGTIPEFVDILSGRRIGGEVAGCAMTPVTGVSRLCVLAPAQPGKIFSKNGMGWIG